MAEPTGLFCSLPPQWLETDLPWRSAERRKCAIHPPTLDRICGVATGSRDWPLCSWEQSVWLAVLGWGSHSFGEDGVKVPGLSWRHVKVKLKCPGAHRGNLLEQGVHDPPLTHTSSTDDILLHVIDSLPSNQSTRLPCSLLPLNQLCRPG